MNDIKEDVKQEVRDGLCGACSAIGCCDEDICDGFQEEVRNTLKEWKEESDRNNLDFKSGCFI